MAPNSAVRQPQSDSSSGLKLESKPSESLPQLSPPIGDTAGQSQLSGRVLLTYFVTPNGRMIFTEEWYKLRNLVNE